MRRMIKQLGWILGAVLLSSWVAAAADEKAAEKTVIRLKDEYAAPTAQPITLGDLAQTIECPDPDLALKLAAQTVLAAPAAGEKARLGKHQVLFEIRKAGFEYTKILLEGPNVLQIYGPGHKVSIQSMIEAIEGQIQQQTNWSKDELIIQFMSAPGQDAWLPSADYEMQINRLSPSVYGANRYEVQFFVNKILKETYAFLVAVKHRRSVYLPVRDIRRGQVLRAEDLQETVEMIDNESEDRQMADNAQELIGSVARTDIRKGKPVKWFALENNFILKRGDPVQILVRGTGITTQTTGLAQQRAAVGDVIPIRAVTGKVIRGKVLSKTLVEMVAS